MSHLPMYSTPITPLPSLPPLPDATVTLNPMLIILLFLFNVILLHLHVLQKVIGLVF